MSDVNMMTSLKALLFSSASTQIPADGAGALAVPGEGAVDFAKLLNGTMEAAPEGKQAAVPSLPQVAAPTVAADGVAVEDEEMEGASGAPTKAEKGEVETAPLPFGLANALQAVQSHRKETLPLPPGLARKIEASAEPVDAVSTPVLDGEPVEEVAVETPAPVPVAVEDGEVDAPELPDIKPPEQPKVVRPIKDAKLELPEAPATDEPVKADQGDKDKPKEQAEAAPLPLVAAVPTPTPQAVPAQPLPTSAPQRETAAVKLDSGKDLPVEARMQPQAAEQPVPAPATSAPADRPKTTVATAATDSASAPVDLPVPATPAAESRSVKSEALALLQLVRDQVAARQPGTPVRAGEPLAARAKTGRGVPAEITPTNIAQPAPTDAAPQTLLAQPSVAPSVQPSVAAPPVVDLSASLGAQMVDMGVSGQWIDGLVRDIAGLSANGAQGRFQIDAHQLGTVQVDIRQGSDGAAVSLTVASEAAEMALRQDSDRLRLDAGLSAVRIAEVKIERSSHVADAARADSADQKNSQQSSSQTANAWANNGQNMAQSQGQAQGQGRWRPQENNAFAAKNSADPAVLNHDETRWAGNDAARARYA
ncbi:flagellar hook-length control protein FliK [Sphingobium sp. JS3065]|uniref:flagellar hook-length control protein FliK n=1 Tax=Sphingobium sp. JS3065 TaxID=2970925 RepID=UPI002263E2EB|nr:flagellar hook-length control protein FliK [Sphingobium sp. JS3065]UZW55042.1 flagellar hook-length control protein FliK [Sphingobium sp. JS3065]